MEFTEISEMNEIITYSRSLRSTNGIESLKEGNTSRVINQKNLSIKEISTNDIYEYEKMLLDSPYKQAEKPSTTSTSDPKFSYDIDDCIDNIIKDIDEAASSSIDISTVSELHNKKPIEVYENKIINENKVDLNMIKHAVSIEVKITNDNTSLSDDNNNKKNFNTENIGNFERLNDDDISKSYLETRDIKSFLTTTLKDIHPKRLTNANLTNSIRSRESKILFKVYFFKKDLSLDVALCISKTVNEVIREIIDAYMDSKLDLSLMRYPRNIEGYELRMLEDDDTYLPDFSIPPLEKNRIFSNFGISKAIAFVEVSGFKPSNEGEEKEVEAKSKLGKMQEIASQKNKLLVHVRAADANFRTTLQASPDSQIKDLFRYLTLRIKGVNSQNYQFRIYSSDPEVRFAESKNFLDPNMPLQNLEPGIGGLELEIVKKKFADDPGENISAMRNSTIIIDGSESNAIQNQDEQFLYNDVSASHYEEFEVIKINHRGKRQARIIVIDGFKLYNLNKKYKEQNMGISEIFTQVLFSKFATKHPERLLKDIREAKIKSGNNFSIEVKTDSNKYKLLEFEAKDKKEAAHIVAKIHYLKNLELKQSKLNL